jgi:hypothetical protein
MNSTSRYSALARNKEYEVFSTPLPNKWNDHDEPVFMPHVNLNPLPYAYSTSGTAIYGKSNPPRSHPLGLTKVGTRYYAGHQSQLTASRNMLGGYDLNGNPFYVPKMYTLPNPCGFTVDGIPFYDAPTIILQQGIMVTPSAFRNAEFDEEEAWEDLLLNNEFEGRPITVKRKLEKLFVAKLSKSLKNTQPKLMNSLTAKRRPFQMQPIEDWTPLKLVNVQDPANLTLYLKDCIEASAKKFNGFRVLLDPPTFEFCSVRAAAVKTIAIRFKAARGDVTSINNSMKKEKYSSPPIQTVCLKQSL